jgi:antitoxin (DNA-binding transcriptional repressor) of toxin-antitoxin stability system
MASCGARIVIKDRNDPIAQIGPPDAESVSWRERLARERRLRLGTQHWEKLKTSKPQDAVDIQASLRAVREDPHEGGG